MKKRRGISLLSLVVIVTLILITGCNKNEKVSQDYVDKIGEDKIDLYIKNELDQNAFQGDTYAAYDILGTEEKDSSIYVYMWVNKQDAQTGISLPVRLEYKDSKISHDIPSDGDLNEESMKSLFPSWFIKKVNDKAYLKKIRELNKDVESQLEKIKANKK